MAKIEIIDPAGAAWVAGEPHWGVGGFHYRWPNSLPDGTVRWTSAQLKGLLRHGLR